MPIQAVVVREVDKDGKIVDPDARARPRQVPRRHTVVEAAKAKAKEKDGVFVVDDGQGGRSSRSRPASWGRPRSRSSKGSQEGEEIVTGSYKTLRTLKDEAKIKLEQTKGKKQVVSADPSPVAATEP